MKKIISVILLLFVIYNTCKSQIYHHFINENKQWKCAYTLPILTKNSSNSDSLYLALKINYFKGDTIINNIRYSKSMFKSLMPKSTDTTISQSGYFFYEDTINQKVFMLDQIYNHTNVLLYDFSLNVGDSVHTYILANIFYNGKVKKVDSVYLTNKFLKRIIFTDNLELIEGIGSTTYVSYPSVNNGFLICVSENNNVLYLDTALFQNCDTVFSKLPPTQISYLNQSLFKTNIYPNPINKSSVLTVKSIGYEQFKIEIFNDLGNLVKQDLFVGNYPIGMLNLNEGFYICRILYKGEQIGHNKFLIINK